MTTPLKLPGARRLTALTIVAVSLCAATSSGAAVAPTTKPTPPPAVAPPPGTARPATHHVDPATLLPKGQPAGTPSTAACNLPPDADNPAHNEWLSCISVGASLDRVPAVGEEADLRISVLTARQLTANIEVTLPANIEWVRAPAGLVASASHSQRPEMRRGGQIAQGERAMAPGAAIELVGRVRATSAGATQIDARATSPTANGADAGSDSVFVTVGDTQSSSRQGIVHPAVGDTARVDAGATIRPAAGPQRSVGSAGLAAPSAAAPCDTHVTGSWNYQDQNAAWHGSPNYQVQAWNANTSTADTLLATGVTDASGNYNLCFDSTEPAGETGTADVYILFTSANGQWTVVNAGNPIRNQSGTTFNVATGSTLNVGWLTVGDPALQRGLHAFDAINSAWQWIPKTAGTLCFDQKDAVCRQLRVNWSPSSTDGTYYSTGSNDVHLMANDPNAATTVIHEAGHAIMDDVYNDAFPSAPNCNPHSIQGTTSAGCAWTEGWAEWFPSTVLNDPFYRWPSGASLDLENSTWDNGWGNGDTTEGRVAGALIDLTDLSNESPWDRYGEGASSLWSTFTKHVSNTMSQFWADRTADAAPVGDTQLAELFQSTIDYGFRDPLSSYAELTRPSPSSPHNFGFNTSSSYWSVTAIRPAAGADDDLDLYDDRGQTLNLGTSGMSGSAVDFVAVDSNRRALGDYYPRVRQYSGTGSYQIESAQGSSTLATGSVPIVMGSNDVVAVRDAYLTAGVPATFTVSAGNASQDAELFVLASTTTSTTWVRPRSAAAASSSVTGAGATEQITYNAPTSGWYGVVLVNKAGSGTYTLTRG